MTQSNTNTNRNNQRLAQAHSDTEGRQGIVFAYEFFTTLIGMSCGKNWWKIPFCLIFSPSNVSLQLQPQSVTIGNCSFIKLVQCDKEYQLHLILLSRTVKRNVCYRYKHKYPAGIENSHMTKTSISIIMTQN